MLLEKMSPSLISYLSLKVLIDFLSIFAQEFSAAFHNLFQLLLDLK
jgi:hypothetical protein